MEKRSINLTCGNVFDYTIRIEYDYKIVGGEVEKEIRYIKIDTQGNEREIDFIPFEFSAICKQVGLGELDSEEMFIFPHEAYLAKEKPVLNEYQKVCIYNFSESKKVILLNSDVEFYLVNCLIESSFVILQQIVSKDYKKVGMELLYNEAKTYV